MFREFNTLELTFFVEFIITLLQEMLKSSTLSITLSLLMCMCVFGIGGWSVTVVLANSKINFIRPADVHQIFVRDELFTECDHDSIS